MIFDNLKLIEKEKWSEKMTIEKEKEEKIVEKTEGFGPILSTEKIYGANDFADKLDVHTSKLRRWSLELEKLDYKVMRDGNNKRMYLESDIPTFLKLKDFIEVKKIPVEESYKAISSMFRDYRHRLEEGLKEPQTIENKEVVTFTKDQFEELMKRFDERTEKAVDAALEKSQQRFLEVLESRDTKLISSLRETMETTKLIGSDKEESKKGFFSKFFGK